MSFILDALRKSEHERQRATGPSLAHVPIAAPPTQTPRWAIVAIVALAAAVLILTVAWWQSTGTETVVAAPPAIERALELPAAPAVNLPATPPPASERPTPAPSSAPVSQRPLADTVLGAPPPTLATAVAIEPVAAEPARGVQDEAPLPTAAALVAQGAVLPPLRLELLAYAPEPAQRFVFINGRKYVEGERVAEGPDVVAITSQGAVLRLNGQRFLLLPD